MHVPEWAVNAGIEIVDQQMELGRLSRVNIPAIITKHAPSIPRCDQCRHWQELLPGDRGVGTCMIAHPGSVKGPLLVPYTTTSGVALTMLRTGPDFGCVKWEQR